MTITRNFLFFLTVLFAFVTPSLQAAVWTIAIDPGHGGKDPGAISRNKQVYEKNVTLSIARELKSYLDSDPNFKAVMTRSGDYYISVPDRSEIARSKKANYLVSIHADSSENTSMRGASVWVLSNRRANDEMGQWLEDHEKQSELLGGAGNVLSAHSNEKYLNQTVLDLQFGHSQREGYELGNAILRNFAKITQLSRNKPQHASLGVLRSPDIPSVLVETGFLSNAEEEAKLTSASYRRRIAYIIYQGIVDYRKRNGGLDVNTTVKAPEIKIDQTATPSTPAVTTKDQNTEKKADTTPTLKDSGEIYTVKSGDRLDKLAKQFGVKADDIVALNQLKRRELFIGEKLKIPVNGKNSEKSAVKNTDVSEDKKADTTSTIKDSGEVYTVKSGDRLDKLAKQFGVKADDIVALNQLKRRELFIGEKLKIPANGKNAEKSAVKNAEVSEDKKADTIPTIKDSGEVYTVKSGDRLDKLAKQFGVKADDIVALNQLNRKDLFIGEKLKIPANSKNAEKSAVKKAETSNNTPKSESKSDVKSKKKDAKKDEKSAKSDKNAKSTAKYHVVEKNQSLQGIARQYGVSTDKLIKLNPKLKNGKLLAGQKIQIKE